MRLTTTFSTVLSIFSALTSLCMCEARPGESYKSGFSGFTASADVGWQENSDCVDGSYASISAHENTYKIRGNGKPDPVTYDSAYFYATLVSECTSESAVISYISLDSWWGGGDTVASITVDSKLVAGTVSLVGSGTVYSESCLVNVYQEDDYDYYYYSNCTEISYSNETLSVHAQLAGQGTSYTSRDTSSGKSYYGMYRTRSQGTTRDAIVASMSLTFEDSSVVDFPTGASASYSYGSIGKSKGGDVYFYSY